MATEAEWAALGEGASQCSTSAGAIQGAISSMLSQLSSVTWKGTAATAFQNAQVNVEADTRLIVNRLNAIANGISKTSHHFQEVDDESRRALDSVTGGTAGTGTGGTDVSAGLA